MNKLKLNKGKAMACLMLTCILFASSCSKDRGYLLPQNDDLPVQNIKEETILKWIKTNPSAKLLSLNWNKAMQAVVNGKNVVRVPTLNVDKLSLLKNNSSLKPNMLASNNLPPGSSGARPKVGVNANYFTAHPPELFFVQENDDAPLKTYLLNFVPKNESEDFGQEGIWTGKLYEWNLNGDTVAVQEIEKNILKVGYLLKYGNNPGNNVMTNLKANKLQSTTGLKDKVVSGFWDWFTDLLADGAGWVGSLLGISGDYRNTVLDGWRIEVDWHAVFASGAGDPNNTQSNGYQGAGLMIYSAYAAGYSNGENLGGSSGGGYTPYHPTREFIELNPNDYIIGTLGITDPAQQDFLYANLDIQIDLSVWLDQHEHTPEANGFVRWAVAYLTPQPQAFNQAFRDLLNGSDVVISEDDNDNSNLNVNIPSNLAATFSSNGFGIYTSNGFQADTYPETHPVSVAIANYNEWIYRALVGANNTSVKHLHLNSKGLASSDAYAKGIGAIGEGIFAQRVTTEYPTSPGGNMYIGYYINTTHIDALQEHYLPGVGGSYYGLQVNYTDINGNPLSKKFEYPDPSHSTTLEKGRIAYEIKTNNVNRNSATTLYQTFLMGINQTVHRANIRGIDAGVLVMDYDAWKKLLNSSYGQQVIARLNEVYNIKNDKNEQKIFLRIEKNLWSDANKAYWDILGRIKNL